MVLNERKLSLVDRRKPFNQGEILLDSTVVCVKLETSLN